MTPLKAFIYGFACATGLAAVIAFLSLRTESNPRSVAALAPAESTSNATRTVSEPDSFMGWKFGEDIRQRLPKCPTAWWDHKGPCYSLQYDGESFEIRNAHINDRIGNVFVEQLSGKMESVRASFASGYYSNVLAMFTERYGKPTISSTKVWRSKIGATFDNHTASWKWRNLHIYLAERHENVDGGIVFYSTARWRQAKDTDKRNAIKEGEKGL
jgi:hypothetical protein